MMRFIVAFAFAACSEAAVLRGGAASLETSSDWAALSEAESEDRSFLLSQLDETESELVKLEQASGNSFAGLQISATPTDKKATKAPEAKKVNAPVAKKVEVVTTAAKKDAPVAAKKTAAKEESPKDMLASLGIPSLSSVKAMKNTMALAPMLAMLKGLYADSKERISEQNVREEKSKKWFTGKEADHKAKIDKIEGEFKNHTLSEEFRTNETRDETRYFTYWQRCRERQHRQFHTNLKIQHAMMSKVKKMVDMYEKALSKKPDDQAAAKKQLGQMTGMPEIVFLKNSTAPSPSSARRVWRRFARNGLSCKRQPES